MAMAILRLNNIDRAKNVDWLYTNWEIGTSRNFDKSKLVFSSYEDKKNKASLFVEVPLLPNVRYYARAQVVTNKGAHKWTNLDVWEHKAFDDLANQTDLPGPISSPDITTDSDLSDHVPTGFTILTKNFGAIGDSYHISTSYWIETLDGKVVWKRLYDEIQKTSILVDDIILNSNTVYRIKCAFHSSSRDTSQISTRTIYVNAKTSDSNTLRIAKTIKAFDLRTGADIVTNLNPLDSITKADIRLMAYKNGTSELAFESKVDLTVPPYMFTVSSRRIKKNTIYLLLIRYHHKDTTKVLPWKHLVFNTF